MSNFNRPKSLAMKKCKLCKHWEFTRTLGSMDKSVWHCRFGFSPNPDCKILAQYNINCIKQYYKEHPEMLQLKFNFDYD